jgi:hypothetical protein
MGKVWNSVDNRMGQLVYDNLFWNKAFKDMAMASTRSVGWNLGTIRELGGGAVDLAKMSAGNGMTHKAAYTISLPITVGMVGAVYQYLATGKGPTELRDYFYPKTGRKNDQGDDERIALPSYMKDLVAYANHPVETVDHKLHPMLATISDMLHNKDYFGDLIRNPDAPVVKQMKQEADFLSKNLMPFGLQNIAEQCARGQSLGTQAGSFFGFVPAPRERVRSAAENKMSEYISRRMPHGATPEEAETRDLKREVRQSTREGQPLSSGLLAAVARGDITDKQVTRAQKDAATPAGLSSFKLLTYPEAASMYELGSPAEKELWRESLATKERNYKRR